jgi:hypothetical protein
MAAEKAGFVNSVTPVTRELSKETYRQIGNEIADLPHQAIVFSHKQVAKVNSELTFCLPKIPQLWTFQPPYAIETIH